MLGGYNVRKHLLPLMICLLGTALVLAGCEQKKQQLEEQQAEITVQAPIVLAEGHTQLADGKNVAIYLEMTKGKYFQATPGEMPYASNFQGTYQFRITESEHPCDALYTQEVPFDDGAELNFNQTFTLEIQDYNDDGNPDFTLGQRSVGSTNMLYQMYSIDPNGKIFGLSFSDGHKAFMVLADATKGDSFSIKLETKNGELIIPYYDTELGKTREVSYQWKNNSFHAF